MTALALALAFQNTEFNIIDRNDQPWLKASEICLALGYADQKSINRIFSRNKDEFTNSMTGMVKLTTPSGDSQETRIFSLRGCHLLAMFSRTKVAKDFRKWVLDILDKKTLEAIPKESKTKQSKKGCLTKDQQDTIKNIVRSTAEALPKNKRASTTIKMWSAIKNKFGCSYKDVDESEFNNIVSLLARLPIEGELLPPPVNALDSMIPKTAAIQTLEGLIYRSTKEHFPIRTFISIENGKAVFVKQLSSSEIIFDVDKMDNLFSSIETLKKDEGISLGRIASSQAKR